MVEFLRRRNEVDALLVDTPLSKNQRFPALWSGVLKQHAESRGLHVVVKDWNREYFIKKEEEYKEVIEPRPTLALGDHDKDRRITNQAENDYYKEILLLENEEPLYLPDAANPVGGMHYSFDAINRALKKAETSEFWQTWLADVVTDAPVVGASIKYPQQVFGALMLFNAVKERDPNTITVIGGPQATILTDLMKQEPRYTHNKQGHRTIDAVLPGNSEYEFSRLIQDVAKYQGDISHRYGELPYIAPKASGHFFDYYPLFSKEHLALYDSEKLTIPLQFSRNCMYGKCNYCQPSRFEEGKTLVKDFDAIAAQRTIARLIEDYGVRRFSIKDYLFTRVWMRALARALLNDEATRGIKWSATTKITSALKEDAELLAASGCSTLEFGYENYDEGLRKGVLNKTGPDPDEAEDIVLTLAKYGITVVFNLISGIPGETVEMARNQLRRFQALQERVRINNFPGRVEGSLNLLEITRESVLQEKHPDKFTIKGYAPYAYVAEWENAPLWRKEFAQELVEAQMREA